MKIEATARDPKNGMTLDELRGFLAIADRAEMHGDAIVSARVTMGGRVKSIAVEGEQRLDPLRPRIA